MSMYSFFNEYPYRNISDTNLDWIFKTYQKIVDDIKELHSWMATHKVEYEELKAEVTRIANEIDTFEAAVNKEFANLTAKLEGEFEALKKEIRDELAQTQADIEAEFREAIADFTKVFNDLKASVESDIASMKVEINRLLVYLETQISVINDNVREYVDDRLADFIAHLPDYENLIVNNPVTGTQTNVQTAINDLYLHFNIFGLTASQYDSLQLLARVYDAKELTAYEYDTQSYNLLDYPDPNHFMRDPFNGLIVKNQVVILELADLHKEALTAAEYDALEITAADFDAMELTAYWFDWYGVSMIDGAIIASDYDALDLTALEYDAKEINAINYDKFAHTILIDE